MPALRKQFDAELLTDAFFRMPRAHRSCRWPQFVEGKRGCQADGGGERRPLQPAGGLPISAVARM
jgi:hypothetical protein